MRVGRIEFAPVSRVRVTTDPRIRPIVPVLNESATAIVQLQELVASLARRVEELERRQDEAVPA